MAKKEETTALETTPATGSGFLALSTDGEQEAREILQDNFGGKALTLADLDKIKIPGGGGIVWSIPSVLEDDEVTEKELKGIIIGWADKKSWWLRSFSDSGGKEQPDCKSNDMVHGLGNPTLKYNDNEQALMDAGKAGKPVKDVGGWLCGTCPHNVFGSAAQGAGKSCQDKRFIVMLLPDSVIPVLIRVPVTSINNIKQYFKRLAGQRKSYLSVVTSFSLQKIKANIDYSVIIPKAIRFLSVEETAAVRRLREPFQAALDAEDAIEAGYTEKDVTSETLDDMPHAAADPDAAPADGSDPF